MIVSLECVRSARFPVTVVMVCRSLAVRPAFLSLDAGVGDTGEVSSRGVRAKD